MNLRHVGITVRDLEKSKRFYCDLLGFEIIRQMEEKGSFIDSISGLNDVVVTTVKLKHPDATDNGMIELLNYKSHNTDSRKLFINNGGISHFALTVNNIKEIHKKLVNANVDFNCEPLLSEDGGAVVTFCRDFEDNLIEMVEVKKKWSQF